MLSQAMMMRVADRPLSRALRWFTEHSKSVVILTMASLERHQDQDYRILTRYRFSIVSNSLGGCLSGWDGGRPSRQEPVLRWVINSRSIHPSGNAVLSPRGDEMTGSHRPRSGNGRRSTHPEYHGKEGGIIARFEARRARAVMKRTGVSGSEVKMVNTAILCISPSQIQP